MLKGPLRSIRLTPLYRWRRFQSSVVQPGVGPTETESATDAALKNDTEIGDDDDTSNTGVIKKEKQESLLYIDHIAPYTLSAFDWRQLVSYLYLPKNDESFKGKILQLIGDSEHQYQITSILPMRRDGGAFVKFQVPWNVPIQDFNRTILKRINSQHQNGLFNYLTKPRSFPVKGTPWIEDLRRFPSKKVKVTFSGPDLTQEEMYLLFRRYGLIVDIEPPKPDTKEPKVATIEFRTVRGAITARNCLNGYKLNDTTLHIQHLPMNKENALFHFMMNHQRISIPFIFTILTAIAFFIFEPIREFCVKEKITHRYSLKNNAYFKSVLDFTSTTTSKFKQLIYQEPSADASNRGNSLWAERYEKIKELRLWMEENVNTFIVIRGPRGSGKHEMVIDHALKDRDNVLVIDCDALIKARNDQKLVAVLAQQLGYFPSFPWLNSLTSFIDLGLQGLIGQKSGISESKEQQFKTMLNTASASIRDVSLEEYENTYHAQAEDDEKVLKEEDYLQQHPEAKPVIVIDRFQPSRKANENNAFVYKEIADWAANLVSMNSAHVIFITDDIGSQTHLSESLPDQVFKTSTLSDASAESAKNYILNQLHDYTASSRVLDDLDNIIKPLGGRMLDLQAFIRRIKSGESPTEAISEMIVQTSEQLTQVFFNKHNDKFDSSHVWHVMKQLSDHDEIDFNTLSLHPLFKSNPVEILTALESTELIMLVKDRGLIKSVRPGKPLFKSSFQNLTHDKAIFNDLEIKYNLELITFENKRISKWLDEINKFGKFAESDSNKLFKPRLQYLAEKIEGSTAVIVAAEKAIKELGKK